MQNLIDQFVLYSLNPYRDFIHTNIWLMIFITIANVFAWIRFCSADKYKSLYGCRLLFFTHIYMTAQQILNIQYNPNAGKILLFSLFGVTIFFGLFYLLVDRAIRNWEEYNKTTENN